MCKSCTGSITTETARFGGDRCRYQTHRAPRRGLRRGSSCLFRMEIESSMVFQRQSYHLGLRSQRGCAAHPAPPSVGRKKLFRDGEAGAMTATAEDSCVH